jgi:hypothetical protein
MARLYEHNHLYIYPEHRDHDEADLFPANWPYTLTSQGSSGSDQPFLEAIGMTLAAFQPETFAFLREERLVAPTLQMILRRTIAGVESRDDYLTGAAHPVVFDAARLRPERMVELAASLRPEEIPPMVRLNVVDEDFQINAGLAGLNERLFDTPSAIARIWHGFDYRREMVVSAEETADPNGRPLTFTWRLLQGDPEKVLIDPLDPEGRRARITIAWHDAFTISSGSAGSPPRETSRIDIGVFALNGAAESAPAFVSVSFPTHQKRLYGPATDGIRRLNSVDYNALDRAVYYDPYLYWSAFWRDEAIHDEDGKIVAWRRTTSDDEETVVQGAPDGLAYRIEQTQPRTPLLITYP